MNTLYDPDFDELSTRVPAVPTIRTQHTQSMFDAFSGNAAFAIGLVTAFLALGAIGFFVLLAFVL